MRKKISLGVSLMPLFSFVALIYSMLIASVGMVIFCLAVWILTYGVEISFLQDIVKPKKTNENG